MDQDIEIIAKKYRLDKGIDKEKDKKKLWSPLGNVVEEKLTHRAFDVTSPPTLIHKRLEDRVRTLELENSKLYKKVSELNERNKKLCQELENLQNSSNQSVVYKSVSEGNDENPKIIEDLEELVKFYKEELEFSFKNKENEDLIKVAEVNYLKAQVEYYRKLPDIESVDLMRESNQKLQRNIEVLRINTMVQEEIIEKLKKELSLFSTRESQEQITLRQELKTVQRQLESEKSHNKSLITQNTSLTASLKTLSYELELQKSKSPKFNYTSILPTSNSP